MSSLMCLLRFKRAIKSPTHSFLFSLAFHFDIALLLLMLFCSFCNHGRNWERIAFTEDQHSFGMREIAFDIVSINQIRQQTCVRAFVRPCRRKSMSGERGVRRCATHMNTGSRFNVHSTSSKSIGIPSHLKACAMTLS
jgi:hypothetical protein